MRRLQRELAEDDSRLLTPRKVAHLDGVRVPLQAELSEKVPRLLVVALVRELKGEAERKGGMGDNYTPA